MKLTVGKRIKQLRHQSRMTQEQLASEIGVTRRTIVNWESSKTCICLSDAVKLCEKLGCTLGSLIGTKE